MRRLVDSAAAVPAAAVVDRDIGGFQEAVIQVACTAVLQAVHKAVAQVGRKAMHTAVRLAPEAADTEADRWAWVDRRHKGCRTVAFLAGAPCHLPFRKPLVAAARVAGWASSSSLCRRESHD